MAEPLQSAPMESTGIPPISKPKTTKKLILILSGLAVLTGGGIGVLFYFSGYRVGLPWAATPSKEGVKSRAAQGHIYQLEPFIVNLANPEQPKYLKIRIELETRSAKPNDEFGKRVPQIRDAVLAILSGKTDKEISNSEGKAKLKEEILLKVNRSLSEQIKTVYFTEFVVQ